MNIYNTPLYRGLHKTSVYKTDDDNSIFNIKNIPDVFPLGKTYFLIAGSELLKNLTDIKVEILDSDDNTVAYLIPNYLEGSSRAISINVSENTAPGIAKITILGILNENVPLEWKDVYNVKWTKDIIINPFLINTAPIKFYNSPSASISEAVNVFTTYSPSSFEKIDYSSGSITTLLFAPPGEASMHIAYISGGNFNPSMVNGRLYVENPNVKINGDIDRYFTQSFATIISDVLSDNAILLENPYYIIEKLNPEFGYKTARLEKSNYNISYTDDVGGQLTYQSESFARIDLKSLKTFSGKVETVKLYKNNIGSRGGWELVGEYPISPNNLMNIETDSLPIPVGYIANQELLDTFWTSSENSAELIYNSSSLMDSMDLTKLTGSKVYPLNEIQFTDDSIYTLEFNANVISTGSSELKVYMSGSGFPTDEAGFGELIDTIKVTSPTLKLSHKIDFDSIQSRKGVPVFRPITGEWYLSNIKLYSNISDDNNPSECIIYAPINPKRRNTSYIFKIVYVNPLGEPSVEDLFITEPVLFKGENTFIDGVGNLITGSICIGNILYSGIEFAGTNSAYVRTIGYEGWDIALSGSNSGFMLWSGSVMPTSSNNYSGVGLEFIASSESYLRFRTEPIPELDIRADAFFIGNPNIQFISGANGTVEISSSKFHLSPVGDLIISGTISAGAGDIGGWQILPDMLISENNSVMLSGSGAISASNFYMSEEGNLTASNALLSGKITAAEGDIGGWEIGETFLSSSGLVLNSGGWIYSSNYESNNRGWIISTVGNGYAEFENVKVRGTLSTTVFEKETINAVGGQLWIANSTTLVSSSLSTDTTMSVANASGFTEGEILISKKFTNTGFSMEYMYLNSASVEDVESGEGRLYVERGYLSAIVVPEGHPEIDFEASISNDYDEGQVIVSTGVSGSGWIRLNANPKDATTPYMDIVERTGSGLYDTELEVRIGDLSGINSTLLYGNTNPGFGIYTNNGFFKGTVTAMTGSFLGKVHAGALIIGFGVSGSNNGIYINDSNYWYDNGYFNLGNSTNFVNWNGTQLQVNGIINITGGNAATTSSVNAVSSALSADIVTNAEGKIIKTNDAPTGFGLYLSSGYMGYYTSSNWNAYISSSGEFLFKEDDDNLLSFGNNSFILRVTDEVFMSGSNINLITPSFFFGDNNSYLSGSDGKLQISSSNFLLSSSGDVVVTGTIYSEFGNIGGWEINSESIFKDDSFISSTSSFWDNDWTTYTGDRKIQIYTSSFDINPNWTINSDIPSSSWQGSPDFNMRLFKSSSGDGYIESSLIDTLNTTGELQSYDISFKYSTNDDVIGIKFEILNSSNVALKSPLYLQKNANDTVVSTSLITGVQHLKFRWTVPGPTVALPDVKDMTIDDFKLIRWNSFSEFSEKGLYVFNNPSNYVKVGSKEFDIRGDSLSLEAATIAGDLKVYGDFEIYGTQTIYNAAEDLIGTTSDYFEIDTNNNASGYITLKFSNLSYIRHYKNDGVIETNTDFIPSVDNTHDLGAPVKRWADIYAAQTTTGGVFETGLRTEGIDKFETGTLLVWKNGKLIPCDIKEDDAIMGISKFGKDVPIVMGAEPILVTGKIKEGDFICTSDKKGHGTSINQYLLFNRFIKRNISGKVIAQALESFEGESGVIKAMIMKI